MWYVCTFMNLHVYTHAICVYQLRTRHALRCWLGLAKNLNTNVNPKTLNTCDASREYCRDSQISKKKICLFWATGQGRRADQEEGGAEKEENEEAEVEVEVVVHGIHPAGDRQKVFCIFVPGEEASSTTETFL